MGSVTRIRPDGTAADPRSSAGDGAHGTTDIDEAPQETSFHRSVVTTRLDQLVNWARSGSLWPLPFGTACCAIEFMSVVSAHYDVSRFGAEVVRFSPRQSDVLIVAGTVTDKQAPILKQIWEQMAEPKWCIAMGVCASSGGFYRAYHVNQGIDEVVPVDVYVPGCPPTPEGLIYAILELQRKIRGERRISDEGLWGRKRAKDDDGDERAETSRRLAAAELLNDPRALALTATGRRPSATSAREPRGGRGAGAGEERLADVKNRVLPTAETLGAPPQGAASKEDEAVSDVLGPADAPGPHKR